MASRSGFPREACHAGGMTQRRTRGSGVGEDLPLYRVRDWSGQVRVESSPVKWSVILGPSREVLDSQPRSRAVLHRSDDPEIWVTVTSERPAEDVDLLQKQRRTAAWNLKVDTMRAARRDVSGAIDARAFNDELNEWEQRFDAGQIPWKREAITVVGTPIPFDVLSITDRWIAVGRTNVVDLLVQGQGSPFDGIALDSIQEVDPPDPPRWLSSPRPD